MRQQGNRPTTLLKYFFTLVTLSCLLSACFTSDDDESGPDLTWQSGNYHSPGEYFGYCDSASIRFYMRSIFNEVYYWYQDIIDTDPNAFSGLSSYFDYLVSNDLTSSGKEKDAYSTLVDSLIFDLAIGESIEIGYGLRLTYVNDESVATIAFVASSSPASDAGLKRGDRIIAANGYALDQAEAIDALYPFYEDEDHTFSIDVLGGDNQTFNLTSEAVSMPATGSRDVFNIGGSYVGYLQFNDHSSLAEEELITHFTALSDNPDPISELILDLRYNSGGYLSVANQVAYMIAGSTATENRNFETLLFNDHAEDLDIEFLTEGVNSAGLSIDLPTLNLNRVVVIAGEDTCSASESIINGLRGIGVEVVLIGNTTCGKPYGFYGFDNCGITFLPIAFEGVNDLYSGTVDSTNGAYADGFKPSESSDPYAVSINGCEVSDDFSQPFGSTDEARLATARSYIENGNCPVSVFSSSTANSVAAPINQPSVHPSVHNRHSRLKILK